MTDGQSSHAGDAGPRSVAASERLLAWLLAGFVLLALGWGYARVGETVRDGRSDGLAALQLPVDRASAAREQEERDLNLDYLYSPYSVDDARMNAGVRSQSLVRARERYRTAMEAGEATEELRAKYRLADDRATAADRRVRTIRAKRTAALKKMAAYDAETRPARERAQRTYDDYDRMTDRRIFLARMALALGSLALALLLLRLATSRWPRSVPVAQAAVGAGALITLTLVVDYSAVSLDFETVGPLGLAAIGTALTLAAFYSLQRYLVRGRPARRIRSGECAACGHPSKTPFCESCGHAVMAPCGACAEPRRIGSPHCGACGAA